MKKIYLDNAATTKPFIEEYDLIKEQISDLFYNPSAGYMEGIHAKNALNCARKTIMSALGVNSGKFIFTSSATESNNMVFSGLHLRKGQTVVISKGEHPSVYNSAKRLIQNGINIKEVGLTTDGVVDIDELKEILMQSKDIALVSIMHVSNETGAVNDIKSLCSLVKSFDKKIIFHSDGVQAFGKISFRVHDLGVDLYTVSAHKIYAPRGIAGLWVRDGITIDPLLFGGGQEDGLRSSTENLFGAIAFEFSLKKVKEDFLKNNDNVLKVKQEIIDKLKKSEIANYLKINSAENSSPYILSLSFKDIKGEVLANSLEADGILISTGSACSTKKAGNRTLEAMGIEKSFVVGSIRLSFSAYEQYDTNYIVDTIEKNVKRLEGNNR